MAAWIPYSQFASEFGIFFLLCLASCGQRGPHPAPLACSRWPAALPKAPSVRGLQGSRVSLGRFVPEGPLGSFQQSVGGTHRQNKLYFLAFLLHDLPYPRSIFLTHARHPWRWWPGEEESRTGCRHLQQELRLGSSERHGFSAILPFCSGKPFCGGSEKKLLFKRQN